MNAYIKKKERSQINIFTPQGTRKGRTTKPKVSWKKEIREEQREEQK